MEITYLGHSSFRIKGKETTLVTDPYAKSIGLKFPSTEADIVTVSHQHDDHNQASLVSGVKKIVEGPGEYEIKGVSLIGLSSFHDDKKGEERGSNTIYVIEMDGLRLAHLGDLGHPLSDELVAELGDIDILMIPVGGKFTIDSAQAVTVVQAIEPSITIPMHYQVPGLDSKTFSELAQVENFLKEVGIASEVLPKLSVKREDISPEVQKIVVLERK
ncbi:MBL fold metallo-hydrolase [Candidatus Woesebacteria bacterium]|nr:MBL fold metallo-hydrolase [Candidatus Woesebacteria bacterium]